MKLLHLFSNYKLTGPAEPALRLASELMQRGHDVTFAHRPLKQPNAGHIDSRAAECGLPTHTHLYLRKHFHAVTIWSDARRLARLIDQHGFAIVHCNLVNDHLTAALAAGRCRSRPRIVRTNHDAVPVPRTLRNRFLFPKRTDALIELSHAAAQGNLQTFGIPRERVHVVDTAIDLARFNPGRELPDLRARWGLSPEHYVVGVAARVQRHRRFDVLLRAAAIAHRDLPQFRLVIIGRGTHKETVAVRPAQQLGLSGVVHFPGFLKDDDFVAGLLALDVKVFLVPGTDGSCRAAREAMAMGKPVVAARRGMLPELVTDGEDGVVLDDTPENLARALVRLAREPDHCRRLGAAARRTALRRFDPARQAEQIERIYERLVGLG